MPMDTVTRARLAANTRHQRRRAEKQKHVDAAVETLTEAQRVVSTWPDLTDEQVARVAGLLADCTMAAVA